VLTDLAVKRRLPTMHNFREMVEAGGLMAYAINMTDFIGRAAGTRSRNRCWRARTR